MSILADQSPLAWVVEEGFVSETLKPIEFRKHRFMIRPFNDLHPDQVCMKSAQVGWSVTYILKAIWLAHKLKVNVLYVLPTQKVVDDFVRPKVDPLIKANPKLLNLIKGTDSVRIKQIGDFFLYYRGAFSMREAISTTGDVLITDERDQCLDATVLTTYKSRLNYSEYKYTWEFSNPSVPNYGVHDKYLRSDQMHWFIKCPHCNHWMFIGFEPDKLLKNHYVSKEHKIFACGKCHKELDNDARIDGDWVPKYKERTDIRGYWVSQMMASWVTAPEILKSYYQESKEYFHNFVLGLPYQSADVQIDRSVIWRATTPMELAKVDVCIGVDNGIEKTVVMGTPNGVFRYFTTESWEEIEQVFLQYNAIMVIDPNPYPTIPKRLVEKYPGRVFINYYNLDRKTMKVAEFMQKTNYGIIRSDRTRIMDFVANSIIEKSIQFALKTSEMEEYVEHWENTYRVIEEDNNGVERGKWLHKEGKPDHLVHATVYYRLALEVIMSTGFGEIVTAKTPNQPTEAPVVVDNTVPGVDISKAAEDTLKPRKRGWK